MAVKFPIANYKKDKKRRHPLPASKKISILNMEKAKYHHMQMNKHPQKTVTRHRQLTETVFQINPVI